MRKTPLVTNEIYHIYNRGVNKQNIFFGEGDYQHFLIAAKHYQSKSTKFSYKHIHNDTGSLEKKVEVLTFCLMPNHFHFLLKQVIDNGILSFMRHLSNSYSHYINVKHKRVGPLFQSRFKNVIIKTTEQLLHVSRYIHLNPLVTNLVTNLKEYPWSSYLDFLSGTKGKFVEPNLVLSNFSPRNEYEQFVLDQEDYARTLEQIKDNILDD